MLNCQVGCEPITAKISGKVPDMFSRPVRPPKPPLELGEPLMLPLVVAKIHS